MNTKHRPVFTVFLLLFFCFGCDEQVTDPHAHHEHETVSYDPITGLVASSESYSLKLAQVEPDPAIKGSNKWKVHLTTNDDTDVIGATIMLEPHMPQHDHVSIPPFFTGLELEEEPGHYEFDDIRFFMVGNWEIIASVTLNDEIEQIIFYVDATN